MNYLLAFLIVIVNFILQSTIFQYISISGVIPNTSLIIIISFALLNGRWTGGIVGLFIGILQDILFGSVIGVYTLIYFLIGFLIGNSNENVFKGNPLTPIVFTAIATVIYHLFYYLFMYFFSLNEELLIILKQVILVEIVYNSLLSIFIYKLISKIYEDSYLNFTHRRSR